MDASDAACSPAFEALLNDHALTVTAQQLAFGDWLGDHSWQLDLGEGVIDFGDERRFAVQLLGSEAFGNNTWLWAWANKSIQPAPQSMQLVNEMAAMDVPEFAERKLDSEQVPASRLAIIAAGLHGMGCYYRCPYDGGAAYVVVEGLPEDLFVQLPMLSCLTIIAQGLQEFELDHSHAVPTFLNAQGFDLVETAEGFNAERDGEVISVTLDEQGRVTNLSTGALADR